MNWCNNDLFATDKKIIFFLLFACFGGLVFSQSQTEIGSNSQVPILPYYNFGKGIGFTSSDSVFQLNIRFRMQNQVSYFHEIDSKKDRISAETRRMRLRFDGFIGKPNFLYTIQLSFAARDVGGKIKEGENMQLIRDAVVSYRPNKHWIFSFGQTKLPGNRQRINSSGVLQFSDRTINNAKFSIDRDFGFQVYNLKGFDERFSYNFKTAISTGEGRNDTENSDTGLAYTGKIEMFPFGKFTKNGSFFEGDLIREKLPKLMISGAYSYNDKTNKTRGQTGEKLFEKRNINSLFLDAMLKYKGWAFTTAYMNRTSDKPITTNPQDNSDISFVYVGEGMDYQLSYLFTNNFEILARYSEQKIHKNIKNLIPNQNQYSIGVNKYLLEHAFKIQAEFTFDEFTYADKSSKNGWYFRFQIEIGI